MSKTTHLLIGVGILFLSTAAAWRSQGHRIPAMVVGPIEIAPSNRGRNPAWR